MSQDHKTCMCKMILSANFLFAFLLVILNILSTMVFVDVPIFILYVVLAIIVNKYSVKITAW